ncbi:MAG: KH domain-containing protein [Actinomycetota bacterium]|nr:KH domain-containing protein [Actinomycetota bacterium]
MSDTSSPFQPPPFAESGDLEHDLDEELDVELDDDLDEELDEEMPVGQPAATGRPADEGGAARAVLEHVARSIVDEPDAVRVDVSGARSGVKLSLRVAPSDMGRVIGKRGRVAQALRVVVRAAAASEGSDASVDIVD